MSEDRSDTNVGEQEVTQSSELDEKEIAPQQLRQVEKLLKPNLKYVNTTIIEEELKRKIRTKKHHTYDLTAGNGGTNYSIGAKSNNLDRQKNS